MGGSGVFGIDDVLKDIRELDKGITKATQKKVRQATNYMTRQVRAAVPDTDGRKNSGNLKKGIKSEVNGLSAAVVAKAPANHFLIVEYGTEDRYHKSGKFVGKMEPTYFSQNVINREMSTVQNMIADGVDEVMKGEY